MHHRDSSDSSPAGSIQAPILGRRGAPRLRLAIPAKLISLYGEVRCILINVSRTGARLTLAEPLAEGEDAILLISNMELFGSIIRTTVGQYGGTNAMEFDDPITDEAVLEIRSFADDFEFNERRALREEAHNWVHGT